MDRTLTDDTMTLHVLAGQTRHGIAESKRLIERRSADLQAVRDRIAATRDRIEASEQAFAVLDPSGRDPHDERNGGGWL